MLQKLKSFIADDATFTVLLLLVVAVLSFGLGRQSLIHQAGLVTSDTPAAVSVTQTIPPLPPTTTNNEVTGQVVASKSGTRYHLASCPGAAQIKNENKVWFNSPSAAEAAGYQAAANCPGLNQ